MYLVLGRAFVFALAGAATGPRAYAKNMFFFVAGRKIEFTILALHGALLGHAKIFMFFFAGRAAVFFQVGHAAAPRGDLNQFVILLAVTDGISKLTWGL